MGSNRITVMVKKWLAMKLRAIADKLDKPKNKFIVIELPKHLLEHDFILWSEKPNQSHGESVSD